MKKELIVFKKPKSPNSEIFRTLRTNIQFMNKNNELRTLLVTSTLPGEGKSWVASNLATTFAQAGKRCIIIDADMRKGRLFSIFGISPKPGLSNYLSETIIYENGKISTSAVNYVQQTDVENLYVIASGNVPPNPSELLVSSQMVNLLEELKTIFDIIIIDGTPCELVTDSIILSRIVDSCIIVSAHKITKKETLNRVIKNIKSVGGNLAGVVLNKVPVSKKQTQYYYYGESKNSSNQNNFIKPKEDLLKSRRSEKTKKTSDNKEKVEEKEETSKIKMQNLVDDTSISKGTSKSKVNEQNKVSKRDVLLDEMPEEFLKKKEKIMKQINSYMDDEKKKKR